MSGSSRWLPSGQGGLGGGDEVTEERVRVRRAGAEFRVKLDTDEEGVVLQLHDLGQTAVRRVSADNESGFGQAVAKGVVDLEAVAMSLGDLGAT